MEFKIGCRYTYLTKETCVRIAEAAKDQGFEVEFGASIAGRPYFEIKDPFKG